jgi:hypothetical protein
MPFNYRKGNSKAMDKSIETQKKKREVAQAVMTIEVNTKGDAWAADMLSKYINKERTNYKDSHDHLLMLMYFVLAEVTTSSPIVSTLWFLLAIFTFFRIIIATWRNR